MALPVHKIELGLESANADNYRFKLDDPVQGQLDSDYELGGATVFLDVTNRVRRFSISRGKSNLFSSFPAAQANIELNNHDRAFDPLYSLSPYRGDIVPRRELRVTTDGNLIYTGYIDDWNYSYTVNGESIAEAIAYDPLILLSNQTLSAGTPTSELTGARIEAVLDSISWDAAKRDIDAGNATLGTQVIAENTNVMSYLQEVASADPGFVFASKAGSIKFTDRNLSESGGNVVNFGGTGVPFVSIGVEYGSDNLYNKVTLSRIGGGTATATDIESIAFYGARELNQDGYLFSTDDELLDLALFYAQKYSLPDYRFSSLEVAVHGLSAEMRNQVLDLELGDIARVIFTPNNIGDPIDRYVQIISIKHSAGPDSHFTEFGFESVTGVGLILSDAEFGKLDVYSLSW
jgi:hypothetical protein